MTNEQITEIKREMKHALHAYDWDEFDRLNAILQAVEG